MSFERNADLLTAHQAASDEVGGKGPALTEKVLLRGYLRLRVDSDGRMRVPKDFRLCLGLDPVSPAYVAIESSPMGVRVRPARPTDYDDIKAFQTYFDLLEPDWKQEAATAEPVSTDISQIAFVS